MAKCTNLGVILVQRDHVAPSAGRSAQFSGVLLVGVASLIGLLGFLYPFLLPAVSQATDDEAQRQAHAADAPLLFAGLTACYLGLNAKGGPKGVGEAVNQTVVFAFMLLFAANSVITALFFQLKSPGA